MPEKVVDKILPTTMIGSYPKPRWYQRYNLDGSIFFRDTKGNHYTTNRAGAVELAYLILEALKMDITERDELLDRLENPEENA